MVSRIALTPKRTDHRVDASDLVVMTSIYYLTYVEIENWQMKAGTQGELMIILQTPVQARYVKVKSYFDDRVEAFELVDAAEFVNNPEQLIKAYYYSTKRREQYSYDTWETA